MEIVMIWAENADIDRKPNGLSSLAVNVYKYESDQIWKIKKTKLTNH